MHHYLYLLRPTRPDMLRAGLSDHEAECISQHTCYLDDLCLAGKVTLFGRTTADNGQDFAMVLVMTGIESEARAIMQADPVVSGGVMVAELYPFRVTGMRGMKV